MSLSLKQQLNNANTDITSLESEVGVLRTETREAVAFHHNFVSSDENITILVNRTTDNASKIGTLETTTAGQATEIDTLESDIETNATRITNINSAFTGTTDQIKLDLATETTNRTDADTLLQSNIDAEALARTNADTLLQSNIDSEAATRSSNDNTLQSNLDDETLARVNADTLLQSNLDSEAATRSSNDTTLQNNIDNEATARATAILAEENRALAAENSLDTKIDTLDASLNLTIGTEQNNRFQADNTLQFNIDDEAATRSSNDTTLQSNIDSEAATRLSNDNTLQSNIDSEATARTNADKKMTFVNVGEAEGLLTPNSYPFAFGFGSPSKPGFGLAIPFNFKMVGYAITVDSSDTNRSIGFVFEHYNTNGGKTTFQSGDEGASLLMPNVYYTLVYPRLYPPGNICIRVSSVNNISDIDARYRVALYFQSLDELGFEPPE